MITRIEISSLDVRRLVLNHIQSKGNPDVTLDDVKIFTKSKQNFKAEWEVAEFKAEVVIHS